ncbi:hypothetical protein CDV26_06215 [Francisella halioticida]|uniref:Domain amino terminal to FKBP-type peptidyl-prolyl isomerase n=1 Tax=Francisella halioticida TaxID=549298 RepID=A0ABN5AWZ7_9GAMM|nr:hypothetical protein [Francisella halioticida]ASG68034.1 hypothetical protein CDV26_06215 [Francisella halioticida]
MKKTFKILLLLFACIIFSNAFADGNKTSYSPYMIGQSLGKISHKSFKAMNKELSKKDFIAGFDDTILDKKHDYNKISDQDSYEIGMIIATQYKSNLKKLIKINKKNSQEFVKGFNSAADTDTIKLTSQDKQILKYFKKSDDEDN